MLLKNKVPHGIMFHHFYDDNHIKGQGAISAEQLKSIIEHYGADRILSADVWTAKANDNSLKSGDVCLTFDDALLCQYDIALPVLQQYNIRAFWFVYTSVICDNIEMLEVYRKFRIVYFKDINEFYNEFFITVNDSMYRDIVELSLRKYPKNYLEHSPFYSIADKKFRFVRDIVLGDDSYSEIMEIMMNRYDIDIIEFSSGLWLRENHIIDLHSKGHIIGLHSHTHPTKLSGFDMNEQKIEYTENVRTLLNILHKYPHTMSHPCNSYNQDTLHVLKNLGITLGFRANMEKQPHTTLEFPRMDHANIIKEIG